MIVDIVVPVHNQLDLTESFLSSLRRRTEHPYRLILVDNGSDNLPESIIHGFPNSKIVRMKKNMGFAGGCNAGIKKGKNPLVAVINNDVLLTSGWLTGLVRALASSPTIAAAAPCSNYASGDQQVDVGRFQNEDEMNRLACAFARKYRCQVEDVSFVSGISLLMRRDALNSIGTFDDRFGAGNYEDNDICLRFKNKGYRIVLVRDTFVYHHGNRTFNALNIDYEKQMERNRAVFEDKWKMDEYTLGCLDEGKDDLAGALKHYLSSMKTGCPNPEPLFRIGLVLMKLGRLEGAESAFNQYLEKCPESTRAMIGLGLAQFENGKVKQGLTMIASVLDKRFVNEDDRMKLKTMITNKSSHHAWASAEGSDRWNTNDQ